MDRDTDGKRTDGQRETTIGAGIAIGAGAGVALGLVLGNLALGIAIGTALGVAIGASLQGQNVHSAAGTMGAGRKELWILAGLGLLLLLLVTGVALFLLFALR